jgi:hypothetical protein
MGKEKGKVHLAFLKRHTRRKESIETRSLVGPAAIGF